MFCGGPFNIPTGKILSCHRNSRACNTQLQTSEKHIWYGPSLSEATFCDGRSAELITVQLHRVLKSNILMDIVGFNCN